MANKIDPGRNDPCPCLSGTKYKHCCNGVVNWKEVGDDWFRHISCRGRNITFLYKLAEILQLDAIDKRNFDKAYKKAFTSVSVRKIYEAVLEVWPPDIDIRYALRPSPHALSALYVGDYSRKYLRRGIARNSLYANKILILDPFLYPTKVREQYNPILHPEQHRQQALRNVNFYVSLLPWIDAGIVELIRSPTDFDPRLNKQLMSKQHEKINKIPELGDALHEQVESLKSRHLNDMSKRDLLYASPDEYLRRVFRETSSQHGGELTEDQFLEYVQRQRDRDPDFLEPLGGENDGQLNMYSSGAGYEESKIIAALTNSYVTTDLKARWLEIKLDRNNLVGQMAAWSPFSKAFGEVPLRTLNDVDLRHALRIRKDGRLDSMRSFLNRVWVSASDSDPFKETNAASLAAELQGEIEKAKVEWQQIEIDLQRWIFGGLTTGAVLAGSLVKDGAGGFLAAAGVLGAIGTGVWYRGKAMQYKVRHPAAFFLDLED